MKLVALCGLHGAGKDTVADALPARKLAFADTLYREVAEAFGVRVDDLRYRDSKEVPFGRLALDNVAGSDFDAFIRGKLRATGESAGQTAHTILTAPRSPRQILQWWGDYRRAQDPDYFVRATYWKLLYESAACVITDVRFQNEAAMVRQLGGKIWQIKRAGHNPSLSGHASENDGSEFNPDVVIINDGSLDDLKENALKEFSKCQSHGLKPSQS